MSSATAGTLSSIQPTSSRPSIIAAESSLRQTSARATISSRRLITTTRSIATSLSFPFPSSNNMPTSGDDIRSQYNKAATGIKTGAIVGGVLGGVAIIAFVVIVIFIVRRSNRRTAEKLKMQQNNAQYMQQRQQYTYGAPPSAPAPQYMPEMQHPKDVPPSFRAQEVPGGVNQVHEMQASTGAPKELPAGDGGARGP
ncbi:hypothetical protein BKA63DRAFT_528069 [Paraphoma chrysanthemicola]|nr:hypothetical protein BKA63DRAFT_528069 [Paraphoma chrysanthemicola]